MSEQITFQKLTTFSTKVSKPNAFCKSTAYCLVTFKTQERTVTHQNLNSENNNDYLSFEGTTLLRFMLEFFRFID